MEIYRIGVFGAKVDDIIKKEAEFIQYIETMLAEKDFVEFLLRRTSDADIICKRSVYKGEGK